MFPFVEQLICRGNGSIFKYVNRLDKRNMELKALDNREWVTTATALKAHKQYSSNVLAQVHKSLTPTTVLVVVYSRDRRPLATCCGCQACLSKIAVETRLQGADEGNQKDRHPI